MLDFFTLLDSSLRECSAGHQHLPLIALSRPRLIVWRTLRPLHLCVFICISFKPHKAFPLYVTIHLHLDTCLPQLLLFSLCLTFLWGEFPSAWRLSFLFSLGLLGTARLFQSVWKCWLHLEESPWWRAELASRLVLVSLLHFNDIIVSVGCSAASLVATPVKTVTSLPATL